MIEKIKDGVSLALKRAYPNVAVYGDEKVRQGLQLPSFFVGLGEQARSPLPCALWRLRQHVDVTYFPTETAKHDELWAVGSHVVDILQELRLPDDTWVRGKHISCNVVDGLMHIRAVYTLRLCVAKQHSEKMEELRKVVTIGRFGQ